MEHTDPAIRRVLIEIPPDCPFAAADVLWTVSGQGICDRVDPETGEILAEGSLLVAAEEARMLRHYGINDSPTRRWHTVTPAALSERRSAGRTGGEAHASAECRATAAVADALRHAGIDPAGIAVRVQSEPPHPKGLRAEDFDPIVSTGGACTMSRSPSRAHCAARSSSATGAGSGWGSWRRSANTARSCTCLRLTAIGRQPIGPKCSRVRCAGVMARVQQQLGHGEALPTFFTGHRPDGALARSGQHEHLFFLADDADRDGRLDRVAIIAPQLADRTIAGGHLRELRLFTNVRPPKVQRSRLRLRPTTSGRF
jgi:CRISPR-associated protein Csb2